MAAATNVAGGGSTTQVTKTAPATVPPGLLSKGPAHVSVIVADVERVYSGAESGARKDRAKREAVQIFDALTNPVTGFAKAMTSTLLIGKAATRAAIVQAVKTRSANLEKGDVLLVYWCGDDELVQFPNDFGLTPNDMLDDGPYYKGMSLINDILPATAAREIDLVFVTAAYCFDSEVSRELRIRYPHLYVLAASKYAEFFRTFSPEALKSPAASLAAAYALEDTFVAGLVGALTSENADLDGDGMVSLEEAYMSLYAAVTAISTAHPGLWGAQPERVMLAKVALHEQGLRFAEPLPDDIVSTETLWINDRKVRVDNQKTTRDQIVLLGAEGGLVGRGMTYIATLKGQYLFWKTGETLRRFEQPYHNSFAVLVAIDDYGRRRDPQKRGSTGYEVHGAMIDGAEQLRSTLTHVGFPPENIIRLYDERATRVGIERVLESFWRGGEHEAADRVFFYFGGHGDTFDGAGVLITYDFDIARPTQSGFLMRDLTTRHSENILAHHVLFTLDACAAGLAVYRPLGSVGQQLIQKTDALSIIRNDTEARARNFLVAGTADQPALWENGGVFTKALISGLKGAADLNGDRLIQFFELATYVSNEVAKYTSHENVRQQVQPYLLDWLGAGKVIFFAGGALTR